MPTLPIDDLSSLIASLGHESFGRELVGFFHSICRADYCAIFRIEDGSPRPLLSLSLDGSDLAAQQGRIYLQHRFWRVDPTIQHIVRHCSPYRPLMVRRRVDDFHDTDIRTVVFAPWRVVDRAILFGAPTDPSLGVTVSLSDEEGTFLESGLAMLNNMASSLLTILAKHIEIGRPSLRLSDCLRSLNAIETVILKAQVGLTRREVDVCARTIYGLSSAGISADLGIGEESVLTYRKRAYQKLEIATQRELMLWHIRLFESRTLAN